MPLFKPPLNSASLHADTSVTLGDVVTESRKIPNQCPCTKLLTTVSVTYFVITKRVKAPSLAVEEAAPAAVARTPL